MTKLEYLKACVVDRKPLGDKNWYIRVFTVVNKLDSLEGVGGDYLDLLNTREGTFSVSKLNEDGVLSPVKIEDSVKGKPLFSFQEEIEVDSTWLPNITGKLVTKVGCLIVNALVLYPTFKVTKVGYINNQITVSMIEELLSTYVKNDDELTDGYISVSSMVDCVDRLNFLMGLSSITNIGATKKTITPPPGLKEYKEKLLKEYGDRIDDPVVFTEFENKLREFDKDYLGDDPSARNMFNNKSVVGRTKTFLTVGKTQDFISSNDNTVIPSLSDGVEATAEQFSKHMNESRYGSFSRGSSTALSGYGYKILQRSLSGVKISKTPCDTTKGFKRLITKDNYKKLLNRQVKVGKWITVDTEDKASNYVGKVVEVRSPMYCTSPNNSICYACMSTSYKEQESGLNNLAATLSHVLMVQFLKQIHGKITQTVDIELSDLCS